MKKTNRPNKSQVLGATAGVAGGAAAGIGLAAVWPNEAEAKVVEPEDIDESPLAEKVTPAQEPQAEHHEKVVYVNEVHGHEDTVEVVDVAAKPTVEVVDYTMVGDAEGNHIADIATVNVEGEQYAFMDTDLNGYADQVFYDANHNNQVDEGEVVPLQEGEYAMSPFMANAQNVNTVQLQEEMAVTTEENGPDYVNDANAMSYNEVEAPDYSTDALSDDMAMNDAPTDDFGADYGDSFIG